VIRQLNTLGFSNILEAEDGVEALTIVQDNPVDLILLDIDMPGTDGLEVLAILKANERTVSLPVIVISGSEGSSKTIDCIEMGAEDYLQKPFDSVLLRARIFSSLEKKRLRDLDHDHLEILNREKLLLEIEQLKTEKLMLNILPRPIAERLKRGEKNISGGYSNVTILFSDLVGFTEMTSKMTAVGLVELLNDIFTRFDVRAGKLGLEKIKTMGDGYMAAGGLPMPRPDHAEICAEMAIGMLNDLENFNHETGADLSMRVGMSSGPVVAGVIGHNKFSYDLWGNTVNTASRMESTSHCSGQPKLDSKLGFPSATAGGNPPFAVCGLRQL
jgi:class 3 adenylate cyclase/CheY-like chemotaxis protein